MGIRERIRSTAISLFSVRERETADRRRHIDHATCRPICKSAAPRNTGEGAWGRKGPNSLWEIERTHAKAACIPFDRMSVDNQHKAKTKGLCRGLRK